MIGTGTTLGRYQLFDHIGDGGMGSVFRAWDGTLDRIVALKILQPEQIESDGSVRRFLREARMAARISHPAVAHVYDFGEHSGTPFIAMEFVPGRVLRREMSEPQATTRIVFLARQLLDGLIAAHERAVVHRDLKPENILLWGRDQIKILDFGLAKPLFSETSLDPGQAVGITGTPRYMAPEQFEGRAVDVRTDVFALGAILFEMLHGRPLRSGLRLGEIMKAPLPSEEPTLGDPQGPLETAILRALERRPEKRWPSAREMRDALSTLDADASPNAEAEEDEHIVHPRALKLVTRARDSLTGFGSSSTLALEMAEKAIELDPEYALARAIHAEACAASFGRGHGEPELLDRAEQSLAEAEELDAGLPDLRVARAQLIWNKTFNFPAETALRELLVALEADPDHTGALRLFASIAGHVGLVEPVELAVARGLKNDPNDQLMHLFRAGLNLQRLQPDEAVRELGDLLRLDPDYEDTVLWWLYSHAQLFMGETDDARTHLEKALAKRPGEPNLIALDALAFALAGDPTRARARAQQANDRARKEAHPHHMYHHFACMESVLGNVEASVEWLTQAVEQGFPCYTYFQVDPMLENLRRTPVGQALMAELADRHEYFDRDIGARAAEILRT